jgi:hypothetical protein
MPAKKAIKKFCSLISYYESVDPDIFDVIRRFCLTKVFMVRKDSDGIAIIVPNTATRQLILNTAYSADPELAIETLKALVLTGYYRDADDFKDGAVNVLNRKIEVESVNSKENKVQLKNGLVLTKAKDFIPLPFKGKINMAVWQMSGKNIFSPEGLRAEPVVRRKPAVGGSSHFGAQHKNVLRTIVESEYANSRHTKNNVYVKKVCLQLRALHNKGVESSELMLYLGNDEISDSYLLDMYCLSRHQDIFRLLYEIFTKRHNEVSSITFEDYVKIKAQFLGGTDPHNTYVRREASWLEGLENSVDVMSRVKSIYGKNKTELARDLFIVFCNTGKEAWIHDSKSGKMTPRYHSFLDNANFIYVEHDSILKYPMPPQGVLTIYGNLLKSDVMLFKPQARFDTPESTNLPILNDMPSPIELKQYSISHLINQVPQNYSGGGRSEDEIDKILTGF